jgi:hypothetical protein
METFISTFVNPLFGAFFGATFALLASWLQQRRNERQEMTMAFVNEFFSEAFLQHRIAVSGLRRKIIHGQVVIEDVAKGYWYPGREGAYTGVQIGNFNEHQHLEFFLGFLIRLSHAYKKGQINTEEVVSALRTSYLWHGELVTKLAEVAQQQIAQHTDAEMPIWVEAVFTSNRILRYTRRPFETSPNPIYTSLDA